MATKTVSMSFTGISQVTGTIYIGYRKAIGEFRDALQKEMAIEKKEVVQRTPKDTGELRKSVKVTMGDRKKNSVSASITAGGNNINPKTKKPTSEYAAIVHEGLDTNFRVGQAKYIESVLRESAPHMTARVKRRVDVGRIFNK